MEIMYLSQDSADSFGPTLSPQLLESPLAHLASPVIIGKLDGSLGAVLPSRPRFPSVLGLALHLCRKLRLIRSERASYLTEQDAHLLAADCLRRKNKDDGDDYDGQVEVSDVLDVIRIARKKRKGRTEDDDDRKSQAADDYEAALKKYCLLDVDAICSLISKDAESEEGAVRKVIESDIGSVVMLCPSDTGEGSNERRLLHLLFGGDLVYRELSAVEDSSAMSLIPRPCLPCYPARSPTSSSVFYCQRLSAGYLGLLLNSRDELSLATVMSGPCGSMSRREFAAVRKVARQTGMPMYQVISNRIPFQCFIA